MDKYIRMLIIKLSSQYKITLTNIQSYDPDKQSFKNKYSLRLKNQQTNEVAEIRPLYGKRAVIVELMQWLE